MWRSRLPFGAAVAAASAPGARVWRRPSDQDAVLVLGKGNTVVVSSERLDLADVDRPLFPGAAGGDR